MKEPRVIGYQLVKPILRLLVKLIYHPKIINNNYIPSHNGVITVGNHRHYLDFIYIGLATKRNVRFLAKIELFKGPLKYLFNFIGCIPVNRKIKDQNAKDAVVEALNNGALVNIFPEGTRNLSDDVLLPFKFGAVSFAQKTGVPIIPYGVSGRTRPFINNLTVRFGKPFYVLPDDDLAIKNKELAAVVANLINNKE